MRKKTSTIRADVDREITGRADRKRGDSADAEVYVKKLQDYLDQRVAELTATNPAEAGKNEQLLASLGEQFQRKVASLARTSRSEAETLIKDLGERLERQIMPGLQRQEQASEKLSASLDQTTKEQAEKFGEIDRAVAALGQRVDGLIASWTEVERANSARTTALVGSLENKVEALAETGHADSQLVARAFESRLAEFGNTTRAEAAKTTALIGSLDGKIAALAENGRSETETLATTLRLQVEGDVHKLDENTQAELGRTIALITTLENKIAALAEKGKAENESLATTLRLQVEGDVSKLGENTHAELARTIALIGSLEAKIAALADNGRKDSATLAQTFQSSLQNLTEAARAEAERTTGLARSLEAKIAVLSEQSHADATSLAKDLNQRIESQVLGLTENAHAESAKAAALIDSLEQKIATLAQTGQAHSETLARALHQKIEGHAREAAENTRSEAARTTSSIESLEQQVMRSSEISRAEAVKTTALFDGKIAALAENTKADSEVLARTLGQQIEHHAHGLADHTRTEAAKTAALVESLEHTVTALAEKAKADSESLASRLGQEIAGHVLCLTDSAHAANAKTLDLLGSLEDRIAAFAEQGRSDSESLARILSQEIERRVRELSESARAQAVATNTLFENKIAALSGQVQADTELAAKVINRQIESSVRQLAESSQAEAAKTAMLIGSLEAKVAAMAEASSAEQAALAQTLTRQIDGQALKLREQIRAESAGSAALLEQKIAALAESGRADSESVQRTLGKKIEVHVQELSETTRAEAAKTTALLENKIAAVAEKSHADIEAVAGTLTQQIDGRAGELKELARAAATDTAVLIEALSENITAAAAKATADSESLRQNFSQQIEAHSLRLAQNTSTEIAKTNVLLEKKIDALAESGKIVSESLAQTLSRQIETQAQSVTENTRAEAARTSALLGEKIAALTEAAQAETASLAKALSQQVEGQIRELTDSTRTDAAKTVALIGSLEERFAAAAEKNRAALELQANTLGAQLKSQLTVLSEASHAQTAELGKRLDTGVEAIEHNIANFSEGNRAELQSRFTAIEEQFRRQVEELSQRNIARTEALVQALRNRVDLGVDALREGTKAETFALQSLLRTLTEQIYLRVVAFTDNFRTESESNHKKIDALRISIERRFDALAESSHEHFSHFTALNGGMVQSHDAADTQLSHVEAEQPADARLPRERSINGGQPHALTNGHGTNGSNGASHHAENNAVQHTESLAMSTHDAKVNGDAIAAETNGWEREQKNDMESVVNGRLDDKSNGIHADDPFDPLGATPQEVLVFEETSKRKPRSGFVRRMFGRK